MRSSIFTPKTVSFARSKNLHETKFEEQSELENIIDQLFEQAENSYEASLPLIASAELGDEKRYQSSLLKIQKFLEADSPSSMKAWMLGRVLSAADAKEDLLTRSKTKDTLKKLLKEKADYQAFYTWALGYLAALPEEYLSTKPDMMREAIELSAKYQEQKDHDSKSEALWAWVMNLSAAANSKDQATYDLIKKAILDLTQEKSVADALNKHLLRQSTSNDYPAWALAKVTMAAAIRKDDDLYRDSLSLTEDSMKKAKEMCESIKQKIISPEGESVEKLNKSLRGTLAEYLLAMTSVQLAKKELTVSHQPKSTR